MYFILEKLGARHTGIHTIENILGIGSPKVIASLMDFYAYWNTKLQPDAGGGLCFQSQHSGG